MNLIENLTQGIGDEFHEGLDQTAKYDDTRRRMDLEGLSKNVLDQTPPIGLNLILLSRLGVIEDLRIRFSGRSINATILGLSSIDGVQDFNRFINSSLKSEVDKLNVVEISSRMIGEVTGLGIPNVETHLKDARNTEFDDNSQDIVIRDHLGNCCPPEIDREIDKETARILKPGGIAIVNITTSEALAFSEGREIIPFNALDARLKPMRESIYDLTQLRELDEGASILRGALIEIEPDKSFVIFGEDEVGHGEWFRTLDDHMVGWKNDGFDILQMETREGLDSHQPPLKCQRQIVVLKKRE